jgi:hypothetical protein
MAKKKSSTTSKKESASKKNKLKRIECKGNTLDVVQDAICEALKMVASDVFQGNRTLILQIKRN